MRSVFAAVLVVASGCISPQTFQGTGATAVPIAVEISGVPYRGAYVKNFQDGKLVNASGVVLCRESFSVESTPDGGTALRIGDRTTHWPGRPLLLIESPGTPERVVTADIPLRVFEREEKVVRLVRKKMTGRAQPDRPD